MSGEDIPENEIEVTPEMIEAGLAAYDAWYASPASESGAIPELVAAVFRAMSQTRYIHVSHTVPLILSR